MPRARNFTDGFRGHGLGAFRTKGDPSSYASDGQDLYTLTQHSTG